MSVVVLRPSEGDGALSADWQQGAESSPPMDNDHNVTVVFASLSVLSCALWSCGSALWSSHASTLCQQH